MQSGRSALKVLLNALVPNSLTGELENEKKLP